MATRSALIRRALAAGLVGTAIVSWACGETGATDPTPVQTFKITPASGRTVAPSPSAAAGSPTAAATPGGPAAAITIAGISSTFDKEEVTAPAGPVTIEFDNRDGGVIHNIHFFNGDDADGESVGETELETGPVKQTLTMDLEAGAYFYQCDAHPTTMTGTLTVE
jgi:plastocyanin